MLTIPSSGASMRALRRDKAARPRRTPIRDNLRKFRDGSSCVFPVPPPATSTHPFFARNSGPSQLVHFEGETLMAALQGFGFTAHHKKLGALRNKPHERGRQYLYTP